MSSCQEKVESLLCTVSVRDLAKHINRNRLERVEEFGHSIDPELLSGILYSELGGINVFKKKELRWDLLIQYYPDFIDQIKTNPEQENLEALEQFNNFNWGSNTRSKRFLELFDLDEYPITNNWSLS